MPSGLRLRAARVVGKDPVTGKYRQQSVSVRGTRAEAERALRRLLVELEDGAAALPVAVAEPEPEPRPRWL